MLSGCGGQCYWKIRKHWHWIFKSLRECKIRKKAKLVKRNSLVVYCCTFLVTPARKHPPDKCSGIGIFPRDDDFVGKVSSDTDQNK